MTKLIFKFDKEKDLYNIWETCNKSSAWFDHKKFVSPMFLEICEGKEFSECKKELKKLRSKMYNSGTIEIFVEAMQKAWNKINDKYFKKLEKIMKKPICYKQFTCFPTTITRSPYDLKEYKWFMVSFFHGIIQAMVTCAHELMHLQFHKTYWDEVEKELGHDDTDHLKEALTVLLNLEFSDILFGFDRIYSSQLRFSTIDIRELLSSIK